MEWLLGHSLSVQSQMQLLVVFNFLCHCSLRLRNRISPDLSQSVRLKVAPTGLFPIELRVSLHRKDFSDVSHFLDKFHRELVATLERAQAFDCAMSLFVKSLLDSSSFIVRLGNFFEMHSCFSCV
jgi:hypothetical protein